jgi:hypothetical protein
MRRDQKNGTWRNGLVTVKGAGTLTEVGEKLVGPLLLSPRVKKTLAIVIPLLFLLDVAAMFVLKLQGGDATALVGGTAVLILISITMLAHRNRGGSKRSLPI